MTEETLYMKPIVGWRLWILESKAMRLTSGWPTIVWEPGEPLRAVHQKRYETVVCCSDAPCDDYNPLLNYGCGIYAFKTKEDTARLLRYGVGSATAARTVVGEVYLWGRIYEHQHGYRAQYAYPKRFVYLHEKWMQLHDLGRIYNVPVEEEHTWKSEIRSGELWPTPFMPPNLYANTRSLLPPSQSVYYPSASQIPYLSALLKPLSDPRKRVRSPKEEK